jgi:hypothetical protein
MRGYLGGRVYRTYEPQHSVLVSMVRTMILLRGMAPVVVSGRVAFLPTGALAMMVLLIKNLVILLALPVIAPVGILSMKILPVTRVPLVPDLPPGRIPFIRSDDIRRSISVIGSPAILGAKKVIQDSI